MMYTWRAMLRGACLSLAIHFLAIHEEDDDDYQFK